MGNIARLTAVAGLAAMSVLGTAVAATARTAPAGTAASAEQTSAATMGVQASGESWCGYNYARCEEDRWASIRFGYQVSPIYYREGQTCPGGAGCADGYYFYWWD
jgi:hypothetical protein